MTERIHVTRRRVLAGIGATGFAASTAGLGTSAFLSDSETFEGNQITAGELDLKVDWQQQYWGPEATEASVYGDAGRPWVNAHPDHDGDGIQSLDSDQYGSVPDDGVVTYEDLGANIQRYLSCETLDHEYDFGDREALVELDDVKPGDSGEITFSYHLCDNPGYIWLCGDLVEASENGLTGPEEGAANEEEGVVELLDAINVQVWYDFNCNNEFDDDFEREILAGSPTTLRSFLGEFEEMQDNCMMLNAGVYPGIGGTHGCEDLDTIEFTADGLEVGGSGNGQVVKVDPGTTGDSSDNLRVWVQLQDPNNPAFTAAIIMFDDMWTSFGQANSVSELDDIIQFDWTRVDEVVGDDGTTYESADTGMCKLRLGYGQNSLTADLLAAGCSTGENDVVVPNGGDTITSADFSYCDPAGGDPVCFPANRTYCLGFDWWISPAVENEIQGDSVSFDLGFYTEQCRHNSGTTTEV